MALIAHYKLDGDATDCVGNNNGSGPNWLWVTGKIGQAASFDTGLRYVLLPATSAFDLQKFSVSAWVYPHALNQNGFIFEKTTNGNVNTQYSLMFEVTNGFRFRTHNVSGTANDLSITTTTWLALSTWNLITCVYDGVKKYIYVNGNLANSAAYTETLATNPNGISLIGAYGVSGIGGGYFFNGYIDDVKIYNHALSLKEVKELNKAKILHYKFDQLEEYTTNLCDFPANYGFWGAGSYSYELLGGGIKCTNGTVGAGTHNGTLRVYAPLASLINGTTYTTSADVQNLSTTTKSVYIDWCDVAGSGFFSLQPGETQKVYFTYSRSTYDSTYRFADFNMQENTTLLFKNFQIEQRDHVTPYTSLPYQPNLESTPNAPYTGVWAINGGSSYSGEIFTMVASASFATHSWDFYRGYSGLTDGVVYTWSANVTVIDASLTQLIVCRNNTADWNIGVASNILLPPVGVSRRISITWTQTGTGTNLHLGSCGRTDMYYTPQTGGRFIMRNVQLEAGSTPTPDFYISDASGYNHHGTVDVTGPAWQSSSKIGSGSLLFNGSMNTESITPSLFPGVLSSMTNCSVSFWRKNTTSGVSWLPFTGSVGDGGGYYLMATASGSGAFYHENVGSPTIYLDGVVTTVPASASDTTNWHHYVATGVNFSAWNTLRFSGYHIDWMMEGYYDDIRIYATALSQADITELYQTRASIDNQGALTAQTYKEVGSTYKVTIKQCDYSKWKLGSSGSQEGFNATGANDKIIIKKNPIGVDDIVFFGESNGIYGWNNGWNPGIYSPIDNSKKYRFSVWVRQENSCTGWIYYGLYTENGTYHALNRDGGGGNNNPYFNALRPTLGEWKLWTGYVWPSASGGSSDHEGRIYNIDGSVYSTNADFIWASGTTGAGMRCYQYYSTNANDYTYWYRPRIDLVDGTEPTIGDLLACRENPNLLTNPIHQGLVTHYTMDNIVSTTLYDEKANYNGTLVNSPTQVDGIKGKALSFNGNNQYVTTTISTPVRAISVWINHTYKDPSFTGFVGLITGQTGPFYLGLGNSTGGFSDETIVFTTGGSILSMYTRDGQTALFDGKWHHLVVSFGGNNGVWVDGVSKSITYSYGSQTTDGTLATLGATEIGKYYGYTSYYTGLIEDVRFYNRNLIQSDVTELYNIGAKLSSSGLYTAAEFCEV